MSRIARLRSAGAPLALVALLAFGPGALAADAPLLRSKQSGPWSAKETWDAGRVPATGDRVVVRAGHTVAYDADSKDVIRLVQVAGTLEFARDRNTRLEVGLLTVTYGEEPSEEGFDCHAVSGPPKPGVARPALLVGTPEAPIPQKYTALVRLHHLPGMDKESCPAVVCCGGRMEFHGAPLSRTWVKLAKTVPAGATSAPLAEVPTGWRAGDRVILTSTKQPGGFGRGGGDGSQTEVRVLAGIDVADAKDPKGAARLDAAVKFEHYAEGNYCGEIANLSRNVVVESADPDGARGHTMYHRHSAGSVSYAEFRHLGKKDVLGRYALHYHLCGDTMRGSYVQGVSVWDSHNRWLTVHGTQYLIVRDVVGYKTVGHGFFLEDGTEVHNVFDRNLGAVVLPGKPLPKQMLPFDQNKGGAFWWANCQNTFTNNVAADCAEYGFKFECRKTADFDPVLPIRQADGTVKKQDVRTLPFVRFENNEAHAMRFFGLNLRGITRPDGFGSQKSFYDLNDVLKADAAGAHPDARRPFWVKNFRVWESNWSVHAGTSGVFLDGVDVFRAEYGIWRSVMDRHTYKNVSFKEIRNKDLHMPFSIGAPAEDDETGKEYFRGIPGFTDNLPPTTVVTSVVRSGSKVLVRGTTADTSAVRKVTVNGVEARATRDNFTAWEVELDAPTGKLTVTAGATDRGGNVEKTPHVVTVE
ncbi:MAG: G8 domain-containing protein [Planctomycetes bacterium]|nr:G8 domain-containing protein [Planctomycetota bacterium]